MESLSCKLKPKEARIHIWKVLLVSKFEDSKSRNKFKKGKFAKRVEKSNLKAQKSSKDGR